MPDFRYGPVELHLVGFEGERPDPGTLSALADLLETGLIRLLDFVLIARSEDGDLEVVEIEGDLAEFGLADITLLAAGLAGADDIDEVAEHIPAGSSAVLIAYELAFARTLAERLAAAGGVVLRSERIPAPIVNAVLDVIEQEEGE